MSDEIQIETTPGLPHDLPAGETLLWQGVPDWRALARNTFKTRWLAAYFAVFAVSRLVAGVGAGLGIGAVSRLGFPLCAATMCIGVLSLIAWLNAKATIYTLTTRRIVMRIGIAFPTSWNFPFARLASADLAVRKEGDGDIVLHLKQPDRVAWLHIWPHSQPWHLAKTRPTLRAIREPVTVARLLADAMQSWATASSVPVICAPPRAFIDSATELGDRTGDISTVRLVESGR